MGLNIWGWREGSGVAIGLSDGPSPNVLDLRSVGITDAGELFRTVQAHGIPYLEAALRSHDERRELAAGEIVFPLPVSEIWAAGVTYERSRDARRDESEGSEAMYLKVYEAERPELFFKHTGRRMAGHGETMGIRSDAAWHVPEPELTVVLGPDGEIFGFTCGNDLSSRDIEAANPLYLPQAKIFHKSASLGPSVALRGTIDPRALEIRLEIRRGADAAFTGAISTARMKRTVEELAAYAGRAWPLEPWTCVMTGTGIVPPDDFALQEGDVMEISIDGIGTLRNTVRTISTDWARID